MIAKNNKNPFILVSGDIDNVVSMNIVCGKVIATENIGKFIRSAMIILIAFYNLEYPESHKPIFQFLQEKIFSIPARVSGKVGVCYNNFFCTFSMMQNADHQSQTPLELYD